MLKNSAEEACESLQELLKYKKCVKDTEKNVIFLSYPTSLFCPRMNWVGVTLTKKISWSKGKYKNEIFPI